MNKQDLLSIINKYVGYAEFEIYSAVEKYEQEKINFTKLHVTKALTSAHINMQLPIEDLEFTLNSYPLTNIK